MNYLAEIKKAGILPALGTKYSGRYCIEQSPQELADFCDMLKPLNIKSYLEVGVSTGGLFKFMTAHVIHGPTYGIDLNIPGLLGHAHIRNIFVGDSHSAECIKWANNFGPFDLVFIDAAHTYGDIAKDTEAFSGLVTKVLAYHDIKGLRDCQGAYNHWQAMKTTGKASHEFIDKECPIGIGAIVYG